MDAIFKTKDGNTITIDTDEFVIESVSLKDLSFKREDFKLVPKAATYKITLESKGFMELDNE